MIRRLPFTKRVLAWLLVLLVVGSSCWLPARPAGAQSPPVVGVDVDPSGNGSSALGKIDSCRRVERGDRFEVDLFVTDVPPIDGIQITLVFDPIILRPVSQDAALFLDSAPGSNVLDFSKPAPGAAGEYVAAAFDFGQHAAESGSGTVIRVRFEAVGRGQSALTARDVIIIASDGSPVAPADSGGRYLGPITSGSVAVDVPCKPMASGTSSTPQVSQGTGQPANRSSTLALSPGPVTAEVSPGARGTPGTPKPGHSGASSSPEGTQFNTSEQGNGGHLPRVAWLAIALVGPILLGLAGLGTAWLIRQRGQRRTTR